MYYVLLEADVTAIVPKRFGSFTCEQIAARNYHLDMAWLRDTSNDPEGELTEPEEIAAAIATHLGNAGREIETMMSEFSANGDEL